MSAADGLAATLYERHGRSVRQYLCALTGNAELAEDLAQEVFVRVLRGADRYRPQERDRAWLFRIARNAAVDHRRRAATRPVVATGSHEPVTDAIQPLRLEIRDAIARLPDVERDGFLMAELGGLSYAEIATALSTTVPAVRSAIYRARLALRAALPAPGPLAAAATPRNDDDD